MIQWTTKKIEKVLDLNGYSLKRIKGGHYIYVNQDGNHISIPSRLKCVTAQKIVKKYNLKID